MCRSECCAARPNDGSAVEDQEPSVAFREMDGWDEFGDGVRLFESYQGGNAPESAGETRA